jgi:hypothetical protein
MGVFGTMIAIKRVCKFFYICRFASGESQTCTTGGGDYCGVFRTLSTLQKEKKKEVKR